MMFNVKRYPQKSNNFNMQDLIHVQRPNAKISPALQVHCKTSVSLLAPTAS